MIQRLIALAIVGGFVLLTPRPVAEGREIKHEYIMGVFPHLPPRELEKVFSPMAADLASILGKPVIFRTSSTYQKFQKQLAMQTFDIAFVQPFDYVHIADKYGYLPLATRQEELTAIIVTKPNTPLASTQDLKHKTVSLPPQVAAVSHLVEDHLRSHGLQPGKDVRLTHYRSHVSCMQQVLIGAADACGTAAPALRFFQHKMKVTLKIITRSKSIPHTLFSVHPRLPPGERNKIRSRILGWGKSATGRKLLARGKLMPLKPILDSDYDVVRKMLE